MIKFHKGDFYKDNESSPLVAGDWGIEHLWRLRSFLFNFKKNFLIYHKEMPTSITDSEEAKNMIANLDFLVNQINETPLPSEYKLRDVEL